MLGILYGHLADYRIYDDNEESNPQIIKRQNLWTGKALCGKLFLIIILVHLIIQIKIL